MKPAIAASLGNWRLLAGLTDDFPRVDHLEPEPQAAPIVLPNLGPAPELQNTVWLNTDGPLRLADLRGKVVLLDMWTFG